MSGRRIVAYGSQITISSTYQVLLQVEASANVMPLLKSLRLSFDSLGSTPPLDIRYSRGDGTGTTPVAASVAAENPMLTGTIQTSVWQSYTTPPTVGTVLEEFTLGPGGMTEFFPVNRLIDPSDEFTIWVKHATDTSKARATLKFEE